ncbi:protein phosphatase 1 regulatory subunit 7-like [Lytechinus pictus]|uniref:protein phosphatase 1 regulatory subunit 7-like n=1 Tax=Lytechinus pictus TaxID=7653 RepID=UPI0030B9C12C
MAWQTRGIRLSSFLRKSGEMFFQASWRSSQRCSAEVGCFAFHDSVKFIPNHLDRIQIGSSRKASPLQRRASPSVSTKPSSAVSERHQRPPDTQNGIVFTNKEAVGAWVNGGAEDQVDTAGGGTTTPTGKIIPRDVMEKCQESEVTKVYDIDLHGANIGTIKNLDMFINLRVLDLSCNCIRNIENLANNKDLRDLKLYDNRISAIANIERLQELCSLQLQHNKIRTIGKGLALSRKLKVLRIDSNYLGKIEARELAACSQLTYLDISSNKLDSLAALNALSSLEELRATHNCLRAVTDLKRCRKLQEIDVSNNKIADLSGIKGLHNLTVLRISHNQLTVDTLKAVERLRSLHTLDVSHNKISELEFTVDQFPALEVLNVCNNRVVRWKSVLSLHKCQHLSELYVQGNPFSQPEGEKPSYHQELQASLLGLEILDGAVIKRNTGNKTAPIMRPMSASTVVSARQVENQLKHSDQDLTDFMTSLSNRFANIRTVLNTLPSEPPSRRPMTGFSDDLSIRSVSAMSDGRPKTRCNSRSRIADAKAFASQNFSGS